MRRELTATKSKGFTLVEIIIVIVIIAILTAIALPNIATYLKDSKASQAIIDATLLANALNTYNTTASDSYIISNLTTYSEITLKAKLVDIAPTLNDDWNAAIDMIEYIDSWWKLK